jgi:CheY-like chemotaxis protein
MSQMRARWQRTIYSFAELSLGIDHLLSQKYLEQREDSAEALYLTEAGFGALRQLQGRPASSRVSERMRLRNQARCTRPILLVEDDEPFREALEEELARAGHHVVTAGDGEEALRLLAEGGPPCVLLLDLMMPRTTGWQLLERLRSEPDYTAIPVALVTAVADRAPKGVVVFKKPLQLEALLSFVEERCRCKVG